jgi:hypothetical protein
MKVLLYERFADVACGKAGDYRSGVGQKLDLLFGVDSRR